MPTTAQAEQPRFDRDDYDKRVRPILANHCYQCHGPDANHREADLRFDVAESALAELESGERAVVPGDSEASELVTRIFHEDESLLMPPPETLKPLSAEQKQTLVDWINAGAPFAQHWSLLTPIKPQLPEATNNTRIANEIDRFVTNELQKTGLSQSPRADKRTLLRRLSFDLIGLPPTPEQLAAFEADNSPDAYEKVVDQLLASPQYGEHMARYWLDLVRYADTHGLHLDNYREMWPYRDWVVRSLNENKSYAEFITDQLAGDLYERPSRDHLVASGFNRLHVTTSEGGSIYDEVFVRNVVDRTEAFGTVFMGLTTGCAVCHDHKFDPISQKDFYSLFAFFNSLDGRALDGNKKDHEPVIMVPTEQQATNLQKVELRVQEALLTLDGPSDALATAQAEWEASLRAPKEDLGTPESEIAWLPVLPDRVATSTNSELTVDESGLVRATGAVPNADDYVIETTVAPGAYHALRLTIEPGEKKRVGRSPNGNAVISEFKLEVSAPESDAFEPVKFDSAFASYEQPDGKFEIKFAIDGKTAPDEGWALGGHVDQDKSRVGTFVVNEPLELVEGSRLRMTIQHQSQWGQHAIEKFRFDITAQKPMGPNVSAPVELGPWHMIGPFEVANVREGVNRRVAGEAGKFTAGKTINYRDDQFTWAEHPEMADGLVHVLPSVEDYSSSTLLYRTIESPIAQTVKVLADTTDGIRLVLNGKDVVKDQTLRSLTPLMTAYDLKLNAGTNHVYLKAAHSGSNGPAAFTFAVRSADSVPAGKLGEIVAIERESRSDEDAALLQRFYRRAICDAPEMEAFRKEYNEAVAARKKIADAIPTTLVFKETDAPREAHILLRGEYDKKGDAVERAVPEALPAMDETLPVNRLGLAQWLLSEKHPLTARVAVNRLWQQVFGVGLVKTSEDLGVQGEPPTHPQLLDWLAVDFREHGWDIKRLMKQLVMSETYQQSSAVDPKAYEIDPENRLYARGPRHRLDAEALRDQALFVSGLLNETMGGPSVKPPQPAGIWKAVAYSGSNTATFNASTGEDVYRRSMYIFWKRTAHAPMMSTFDAPNRESCTARRERTNTPLQALLLLNEQMYVECAIKLAERVMLEIDPADTPGRITEMFESATGRRPTEAELNILGQLIADSIKRFREQPEAAKELLSIGQSKVDEGIDPAALASYTIVANTILNLDEVVTKH